MPKVEGLRSKGGKIVPSGNDLPADSARVAALKMLARRELSESQIRQRLARRGHAQEEIDAAIERLKAERAIDDSRVAGAIARTETSVKRRGKRRVTQQIEQAGISRTAARQAVDETFGEHRRGRRSSPRPSPAVSKAAGRSPTTANFSGCIRYLIRQGFDADDVFKALSARRPR